MLAYSSISRQKILPVTYCVIVRISVKTWHIS